MYLKRLYSEPQGLFEEVRFKNGVNFIYGKKDTNNDPKASLNSIGKSTFLDLLDFCLLASHLKQHNPRLNAAGFIIDLYFIVLEFDIEEVSYTIKRKFSEPKVVFFGKSRQDLEELDLEEAKLALGQLVFGRKEYKGIFYPKWFRPLISFYLKIQKFKKDQFNDPIKYSKETSETELNIYHLYLMGLNNCYSFKNFRHLKELKDKKPAIAELKRLIQEKYSLKDVKETNNNVSKLKLEIKRLDQIIETFKLGDQYEKIEEEANKYTKEIKEKWFENFSDRKKIEAYEASYNIKDSISTTKIKNLYKEVSEEFADFAKATLDDAIKFRRALSQSRRAFLSNEIKQLQEGITSREAEIDFLEGKRAKLFSFLSAQDAIKDLTDAFVYVSEKRNELADLESNVKTFNELETEKNEIELELKRTENEIQKYVNALDKERVKFYEIFTDIYNHIYIETKNESSFSINFNKDVDRLVEIKVNIPDMFGKGKNQGRTLVYDLFILLNSISTDKNFPKFLVHDGIFDGVDKAHFVAVYEYIERLANRGEKIQYITTFNEEGTLSKSFGESNIIDPKEIESQAVLVLSPSKKLFKQDFQNTL